MESEVGNGEGDHPAAWPLRDLVPDEPTALAIGIALIRTYFGEAAFEKFKPYKAHRIHDEWGVIGTNAELDRQVHEFERLNPNSIVLVYGGGMPGVSFSAKDVRVSSIAYQR